MEIIKTGDVGEIAAEITGVIQKWADKKGLEIEGSRSWSAGPFKSCYLTTEIDKYRIANHENKLTTSRDLDYENYYDCEEIEIGNELRDYFDIDNCSENCQDLEECKHTIEEEKAIDKLEKEGFVFVEGRYNSCYTKYTFSQEQKNNLLEDLEQTIL